MSVTCNRHGWRAADGYLCPDCVAEIQGPSLQQQNVVPLMTLRDLFAAQWLIGAPHGGFPELRAKEAYEIADAMIAERAKP